MKIFTSVTGDILKGKVKNMDRFSEQLVERASDKKSMFLKGLVIAGLILVLVLLGYLTVLFQYSITLFCLVAGAGAIWLAVYIMQGLNTEYEYIVTNDDLDIDKISGKRKRKRLISVDLKSVDDFGPYLNETELNPDVTVLAEDGTGIDLWYVFIETESTGKIAIIFNPDERTRKNIIGGLEPVLRAKLGAKYLNGEEQTEESAE